MYGLIIKKLKQRKKPINVAIVGSGWFGGGLARELYRIDGVNPKVLIDKDPDKAVATYLELGINKDEIAIIRSSKELMSVRNPSKYIVFSEIGLIKELKNIDVVYEATGDILGGAKAALISIDKGIPFVSANFEMDATIGLRVANLAKEKGVLYSNSDGDQPSVLARMIDEATTWGFEPKIVGNCKAFLDVHQNPTGVRPFVPSHQSAHMVCGMADGTKQSIEMAVLGNARGYYPLKRGMYGPTTTKQGLIKAFDDLVNLRSLEGTYVDFVFGIKGVDQGGGVFVIAHKDSPHTKEDMKFLKKGEGPFYLFFRDHHLCYLEAVSTIAEAVLFNISTFFPKGRYIDVMSVAKRDLAPGQKLDGIGGHDCYGEVERAEIAAKEKFLPVGLAKFATVTKNVHRDAPITYDAVALDDNIVVEIRREQEKMPLLAAKRFKEKKGRSYA